MNLGGWLVIEKWMTPQLFRGVAGRDEYSLVHELGYEEASRRILAHRKDFITESNFQTLANQGFTLLRLPVGYWFFKDDPGFVSDNGMLDTAFEWAQKYNISIVLDLHALPGSQNGNDHSGRAGEVHFYRRKNQRLALQTLQIMAQRYGKHPQLKGLSLVNEPKIKWPWQYLILKSYYRTAYKLLRPVLQSTTKIIISDAFLPRQMGKWLAKSHLKDGVVLDIHLYQIFSSQEKQMTFEEHIAAVSTRWAPLLDRFNQTGVEILVGEWSAALPAYAYSNMPGGEKQQVIHYYSVQRNLFYSKVWAYCYWSYHASGVGVWSWKDSPQLHR